MTPNKPKATVKEQTDETKAAVKAAPDTLPTEKALYAYADFEIEKLGLKVKAGEQFVPAAGWVRDVTQETFLMGSKQKNAGGSQVGVVFTYQGEVVNPQERNPDLRERRTHTAVLPLEER